MSELRWSHRATPRHLESIADNQVLLWELKQHEARDPESSRPNRPTTAGAGKPDQDQATDRLGLHYWRDAIVDELTRVMSSTEHSDAPGGFVEDPMSFVAHKVRNPFRKKTRARRRR